MHREGRWRNVTDGGGQSAVTMDSCMPGEARASGFGTLPGSRRPRLCFSMCSWPKRKQHGICDESMTFPYLFHPRPSNCVIGQREQVVILGYQEVFVDVEVSQGGCDLLLDISTRVPRPRDDLS